MDAQLFKRRFCAALPEIPPGLDLQLDEFVRYDPGILKRAGLSRSIVEFLSRVGMPRDASPFLSFEAHSPQDAQNAPAVFGLPEGFFPFGHNGSGDNLAIEVKTGQVVYFNHDNHMKKILINSSFAQFVESLCIYQEHLTAGQAASAGAALSSADPNAFEPGTMWHAEVRASVG